MLALEKSLTELGLTKKEAEIYLAILHSGRASMTDVAKATHINRTTLYHSLDTLLERGLISKTIKGKRTLFVPEDPEKILRDFEKRRAAFMESLPHVEQLYKNARHKPSVRLYDGLDGIMQILLEIGSSLVPIDAFFSPRKYFRAIPNRENSEFLQAIEENENVLRDLVERDALSEKFIKDVRRTHGNFHKVKLLPKDFPILVDVLVTGSKTAMISFDHMMGLIIENDEIASFHKSIHAFIWKNLP